MINEINTILRKGVEKLVKKTKNSQQHDEFPDDLFFPDEFQGHGNQDEKKDVGDLAHWEKEVTRLLVSFGDQPIKIELLDDNDEKTFEEVTAAVYIIDSINNDGITFEDETCQKIFNFYNEVLENDKLPTHQDFTNHHDQVISKFAIDIYSVEYELSPNWEKHKIFTNTEEMQLTIAVVNSLFAFQLSKLTKLILNNQNQLKTEKSSDIQFELLEEQLNLLQIKKQLAAKLGRIILS